MFLNTRMISGLLAIALCAWIAGWVPGTAERMLIMVVGATAVFLAMYYRHEDGVQIRRHRALDAESDALIDHPQFGEFMDAVPDPLLFIQNDRVIAANAAATDLLGKEVLGQNVRLAIRHAGAIERLTDPQAEHSGRAFPVSGLGRRDQYWDMRIQSLDAQTKAVSLRDRTMERATEKVRADFVANASHELMTPLASIKGGIETLQTPEASNDADARERFLGIMAREAVRMQSLIRDLISLSRIEAEGHDLIPAPVALSELVGSVVEGLKSGNDPRAKDIVVRPDENLPDVSGDPRQIELLVSNLVANAMKYGTTGTPVTVAMDATPSGSMVALSVSDQGEGIPPEHIPRLTERFYRVDSGRSRSVGGTGLGLSLVKHIVERHRGHLEIRSKVGEGTTVTVRLPVSGN